MSPSSSRVPLAVLSIAALALLFGRATGNDADPGTGVVEPVVRATRAPGTKAEVTHVTAVTRARRETSEAVVDLFPGRTWTPPPAPAAAVVAATPPPPPAPTAPALPYAYMGRVESADEKPLVWLAHGERLVQASPGEIIDQIYRLESLGEDEVVFTFLPLNQKQVLRIEAPK